MAEVQVKTAQEQVIQARKDNEVQRCEIDFGGAARSAHQHLGSVSGIAGIFRDPFGVLRSRYRKELSAAEAGQKHCVASAEQRAAMELSEERAKQKK